MRKLVRRLVKTVLNYFGTKPSKKQVGAVTAIAVVSFGLGMTYTQVNNAGQVPVDCESMGQGLNAEYPSLEPYYNDSIGACMVPRIYLDNYTDPGGNQTTNSTNLTQ